MLSQISWTLFLSAVFVALVLYYFYVVLCYYPKEALSFLLGKKNELPPGTAFLPASAISLMGKALPEPTPEEYLHRYQPKERLKNVTGTEDLVSPPPVVMPMFQDDEEDSSFFLVASDAAGA
ncbi:MAG: hypothetical protein EOO89_00215, partial [Pedobacter sp.]